MDSATRNEARESFRSYLQYRLPSKSNSSAPSFRSIPTIDLSSTFPVTATSESKATIAGQIHTACTTSGFFYITNHSIPPDVCDSILSHAKRFFHTLPLEKKQALHISQSPLFRGWEPADSTSINATEGSETKEGFNWGYEEALDPSGGDGKYVELDGKRYEDGVNRWPKEKDLPGFFEVVKEYYCHCLRLARHIFRLFALSLSLPEDHFETLTQHPGGIGRILYYPPSLHASSSPHALGLGSHTDYECFTLLLQSASPGLEVLSPDGVWVEAPPVEGALVVNVADFLMRWTRGKYKSTVHRVVNRKDKERYSVPFFFSVDYDAVVTPLGEAEEGDGEDYRPIRAGEYILERLRMTEV